ncbi:MAG: FAD-binding domain-containing protein, partial [Armatimonadota bacterium]|nr:FAD-binding domain-containing protein [Armatimonadota bacterium]
PYFRIFNPVLQAQKFDPKGEYIRQYVPELREASDEQLSNLETLHHAVPDYPPPMVSPEEGRQRFLQVAREFFGESVQGRLPLERE